MREEIEPLGDGAAWIQVTILAFVVLIISPGADYGGEWVSHLWDSGMPECEMVVGTVVAKHNYTDSDEEWADDIQSNWAIEVSVDDSWAGTSDWVGIWVSESIYNNYEVGDQAAEIICEVKEHDNLMDAIEGMIENGWIYYP